MSPSRRARGPHAVTAVAAIPCCLPRGRESEAFAAPPPFARAWVVSTALRSEAMAQQALAAGCMTRAATSLAAAAREAASCRAARASEAQRQAQPPAAAGGVEPALKVPTAAASRSASTSLPEVIVCDVEALRGPLREAERVIAVVERLGIPVIVASATTEAAEEAVGVSVSPPSGVQWVEWPLTAAGLAPVCRRLLGMALPAEQW